MLNLKSWDQSLFCRVQNGSNIPANLDFNRLRYIDNPKQSEIKNGTCKFANRDSLIQNLFFVIAKNEEYADSTKYNMYSRIQQHISFCDKLNIKPFTKYSIEKDLMAWHKRQMLGEIKDVTETSKRSVLLKILDLLDLANPDWMPSILISGVSQRESIQGYLG